MSPVMTEIDPVPALSTELPYSPEPTASPDLVALVDLKWLMYAYGGWIDVPRLCRDSAYAMTCLDRALAVPSDLVRNTARRVLLPLIKPH